MARLVALSGEALLGLVEPAQLVEAMGQAMIAAATGKAFVPPREHIASGSSTLLVMPSAAPGLFGAKLVTLTPGNAGLGGAVTQGVMLLLDDTTGEPQAILDAAALTCQRTGAVGALAITTLAEPGMETLGLVGCGVQGAWTAILTAAVTRVKTVACLSRGEASFARFAATLARFAPDLRVERCASAADVLDRASCVVTATTSATPVLPDDHDLLRGKLLVSIGSFRPAMQELPDAAYGLASRVVVDSPHAAHEVGDLIGPISRGLIAPDDIVQMADLLLGSKALDGNPTRIFKSVGFAAFDLFAAELMVRTARARGLGQEVSL